MDLAVANGRHPGQPMLWRTAATPWVRSAARGAGDSASMLAEACGTGRRVWVIELPERRTLGAYGKHLLQRLVLAPAERPGARAWAATRWLADLATRGWIRYPRDLRHLHAALFDTGRVLPLGRPFTAPPPPPLDETEYVATRVRALFENAPACAAS